MAKKKRRAANDRAFKHYKANNSFVKNKIEKLEKEYVRTGAENLLQLIKDYKDGVRKYSRGRPKNRNSIRPKTESVFNRIYGKTVRSIYPQKEGSRTAGEQLAELLDIEYKRPVEKKKRKPRITVKNSKSRRMEKLEREAKSGNISS